MDATLQLHANVHPAEEKNSIHIPSHARACAAALDSHLDLGAGCGRPAFLVRVQVFREEAPVEGAAGANVTIVFVHFAYFLVVQQ